MGQCAILPLVREENEEQFSPKIWFDFPNIVNFQNNNNLTQHQSPILPQNMSFNLHNQLEIPPRNQLEPFCQTQLRIPPRHQNCVQNFHQNQTRFLFQNRNQDIRQNQLRIHLNGPHCHFHFHPNQVRTLQNCPQSQNLPHCQHINPYQIRTLLQFNYQNQIRIQNQNLPEIINPNQIITPPQNCPQINHQSQVRNPPQNFPKIINPNQIITPPRNLPEIINPNQIITPQNWSQNNHKSQVRNPLQNLPEILQINECRNLPQKQPKLFHRYKLKISQKPNEILPQVVIGSNPQNILVNPLQKQPENICQTQKISPPKKRKIFLQKQPKNIYITQIRNSHSKKRKILAQKQPKNIRQNQWRISSLKNLKISLKKHTELSPKTGPEISLNKKPATICQFKNQPQKKLKISSLLPKISPNLKISPEEPKEFLNKSQISLSNKSGIKYLCEDCGLFYESIGGLKTHIKASQNTRAIPNSKYFCKICKNGYLYRKNLTRHLSSNFHAKKAKRVSLNIFLEAVKEMRRERSVEVEFICSICEEKFKLKGKILSHVISCKITQ